MDEFADVVYDMADLVRATLSPDLTVVLNASQSEACRFNHRVVVSAHLIVSVLKHVSNLVRPVLMASGITLKETRYAIYDLFGSNPASELAPEDVPISALLRKCIDLESVSIGDRTVPLANIVVRLLEEDGSTAAQVLSRLGIAPLDVAMRLHVRGGGERGGDSV